MSDSRDIRFVVARNIVRHTLNDLPGPALAKECRLALPEEKRLTEEVERAGKRLSRCE